MKKRQFSYIVYSLLLVISAFLVSAACVDVDGDGYGDYADSSCTHPYDDDCMDTEPSINPGATEVCDNMDNNCDGYIDDLAGCSTVVCGNKKCDTGETDVSCPADCYSADTSSSDACGDFICGLTEDEASCRQDCFDYSTICNLASAEWYSGNTIINDTIEGSTVKLVVKAEKIGSGALSECNDMPVELKIYEIDDNDHYTDVSTFNVNITSGKAEVNWPVVYEEESAETDAYNTIYPDYVLIGLFYYAGSLSENTESEKLFVVYPAGYSGPKTQETFSGDVSSTSVCGDDTCDSSETASSCPADCLVATDQPVGPCTIDSASWADEAGVKFDKIKEGSKVILSADVTDCDTSSIKFAFLEYDAEDTTLGEDDFLPDAVDASISGGKATAEWSAIYIGDEPDQTTGDTYPEYILFVIDSTNPDATPFLSDTAFIVYKEGQAVPDDVDIDQQVFDDVDTGQQAGAGAIGSQYRVGTGGRDPASDTEGEEEFTCGDGSCDITEDEETCPGDCANGTVGIIFFIFIFIILGGSGLSYYLWKRHKNKVAEAAKKAGGQDKDQAVQHVQPTEQPKSPFANDDQLKATMNFIKTARTQGISDEKIKEMLKNGNYNPQQIEYAFANMK
ncbi:MAG: putative metal-binding motif-containing protein [Candidatus Woesearchaeota archaeon]